MDNDLTAFIPGSTLINLSPTIRVGHAKDQRSSEDAQNLCQNNRHAIETNASVTHHDITTSVTTTRTLPAKRYIYRFFVSHLCMQSDTIWVIVIWKINTPRHENS